MKPLLLYLLQVIVISGLLYGYYHLALRNKTFHRYNRFYLIAAALLSIIIPFLNIPLYFSDAEKKSSFVLQTLTVISSSGGEETFAGPVMVQTESWFTWQNILTSLYILVGLMVLIRIFISLFYIRRVLNNNPVEKIDRIRFVNTAEPSAPFSFFRWMFWNKKIELQSEKGQQIFRHELFHIEQKHSADIILLELISMVFWINPFFHLIKKEIKAIHEFLADRFAIKENKHWEYAELLLMQALDTRYHLVNPFFHNQIKRRIAMITTSQKPGPRYFRKIMVLPLTALAVILFAFSYRNKTEKEILTPDKPFTVVIDVGHGGEDGGAIASDGTLEKNINLAIALKVKELNEDKDLNILLTREDDSYPDLQGRNDFTKDAGADLFISIHVNSSPNKEKNGIEAIIASTNKTYEAENRILGSILLNYFAQVATTEMQVKQRDVKVYLLEQAPCPSALIECGYISNDKDLSLIKMESNQQKLAKAILNAIDQYRIQKEDEGWEERKSAYRNNGGNSTINLKNDFKNVNRLENYNGQSKTVIEADSILFHGNSGNPSLSKDQLAIIDGEVMKPGYLDGKTIVAKKIAIYPANDPEAIRKWGNASKPGVVEFSDVQSINIAKLKIRNTDTTGLNDPLIVIDGKVQPGLKLNETNKLPADQIKAVNVLKDKTATDKYGEKGKNGVIEITTKESAISDTIPQKKTDNIIFSKVEVEPKFPGGTEKWKQYLRQTLNPLVPIDSGAAPGKYTVVIQFIVDKDGKLSDFMTETKHGYGMEEEVIRILKVGPGWIPAIQNGQKVKAYVKQQVIFEITDDPDVSNETTASTHKVPEISINNLKKSSVHKILGLADELEITGYVFTSEIDKLNILEIPNSGNSFNEKTKQQFNKVKVGSYVTFDRIKIIENGKEKKIPGKAYKIVD